MIVLFKRFSVLCYLLIASVVFNCGEKEVQEEVVLRPVKFTEVSYLGGDKERRFSGTAKTEKIINLSFRSNGIITKLDGN